MRVQVTTTKGPVLGRQLGSSEHGAVFLGIPHASAGRFAKPEPVAAWTQPREALAFGPSQPQQDTPHQALLGLSPLTPASEDCLSVNVWTPGIEGSRPVLVWIHGGGFSSGSAAAKTLDGAQLSARGELVVVTFNYRVGVLGFAYLGSERCNFGLYDQLSALVWVRENIAAFGGDPARVTLGGNSAGAGSVCALLASELAEGAFSQAILQSGAFGGYLRASEGEERRERVFEILQKAGHDTSEAGLATLPVEALLDAQSKCASERQWRTGMLFAPVVGDALLPRAPLDALAERGPALPVLIGTNRDELQLFKYGTPAVELPAAAVVATIAQALPGADAQAVYTRMHEARSARGASLSGMDMIFAVHAELALRLPALALAELQGARAPVYMYEFDWASPATDGALGAFHGLELPFVFGQLAHLEQAVGDDPSARLLAESMIDAWAAFCHRGDPQTEALGVWPPYEALERQTMRLGRAPQLESDPRAAERRVIASCLAGC